VNPSTPIWWARRRRSRPRRPRAPRAQPRPQPTEKAPRAGLRRARAAGPAQPRQLPLCRRGPGRWDVFKRLLAKGVIVRRCAPMASSLASRLGGHRRRERQPARGRGRRIEPHQPVTPRPRGLVVAIDGPSGAGKSTAGRASPNASATPTSTPGPCMGAHPQGATGRPLSRRRGPLVELARATRIDLEDGGRRVRSTAST
jgi:hypothetical protein